MFLNVVIFFDFQDEDGLYIRDSYLLHIQADTQHEAELAVIKYIWQELPKYRNSEFSIIWLDWLVTSVIQK